MRKLTLKVDDLEVTSFDTSDQNRQRGTVRGNDTWETEWCTGYPDCVSEKCETPDNTCNDSCDCTQTCETLPVVYC